jgi:hypothetical protein
VIKNAVFCYVAHFTHWQCCDLNSWIPRASNVSHTVVLRPLKAGYFNFTSATVSYLAQEGGQVVVSSMYLRWVILWDRTYLFVGLFRWRPSNLYSSGYRTGSGETPWSVNNVFKQRSWDCIWTLNRIGSQPMRFLMLVLVHVQVNFSNLPAVAAPTETNGDIPVQYVHCSQL